MSSNTLTMMWQSSKLAMTPQGLSIPNDPHKHMQFISRQIRYLLDVIQRATLILEAVSLIIIFIIIVKQLLLAKHPNTSLFVCTIMSDQNNLKFINSRRRSNHISIFIDKKKSAVIDWPVPRDDECTAGNE